MELQRQSSARNGLAYSARRARLAWLLANGFMSAEIRTKLDCPDSCICRWSQRFEFQQLMGLLARHAGRERYKVTEKLEACLLAWTPKRKPVDGSTQRSSPKPAADLGRRSLWQCATSITIVRKAGATGCSTRIGINGR